MNAGRQGVDAERADRRPALPHPVGDVVGRLVALIDTRLPNRLEALYIVGSVAQGDFQPGRSDIDFVAVLDSLEDCAPLGDIHAKQARLHPEVHCDGIYVMASELAHPAAGAGPCAREGQVAFTSPDERHPVTWLILRDDAIAWRGPGLGPATMTDRGAAIAYSRRNLEAYWRPWVEQRETMDGIVGDTEIVWGVLGIARLHVTIKTGRVPSKAGAASRALADFADHGAIIEEAAGLRRQPDRRTQFATPVQRHKAMTAFMRAVLDRHALDGLA
jgi:hypothetical protein